MRDLHLNFGKLDMLMRVKRFQVPEFPAPARTSIRWHGPCPGRLKKRLLGSLVPLLGAGFALFFGFVSLCPLLGWVRRRWLVGVLRVLPKPGFQFFDAFGEFRDDLLLSQEQGPHGRACPSQSSWEIVRPCMSLGSTTLQGIRLCLLAPSSQLSTFL